MRYLYILPFLFLSSFLQAAKISGSFSASDTITTILLIKVNYDTRNDSTVQKIKIGTDKSFAFTITLQEPAIYYIATVRKNMIVCMVVKPEDIISLKIEDTKISVTGSPETQYLIDYENYRKAVHSKWLKPVYDSSAAAEKVKDKEKLEYWNKQQTSAMDQYKAALSTWSKQSFFVGSLASIHHSLRWNPDTDIVLMDTLLAAYKRNYSGYLLTRQFENKVIRTKRIAMGVIAPDFQSTTPEGKTVGLSSIKSKYILLDFWASWCGPCRQESPTLVRLYKEYQDKGFTIISVSLDDEEAKWLKAIKKDHYTWTNVSELKGWNSPTAVLYGVSSIPGSFLLDSEGKIIAKNLRGQELENKLSELMLMH